MPCKICGRPGTSEVCLICLIWAVQTIQFHTFNGMTRKPFARWNAKRGCWEAAVDHRNSTTLRAMFINLLDGGRRA